MYEEINHIIAGLMKADNFFIALYDDSTNLISFPYFVDECDEKPEPGKFGRSYFSASSNSTAKININKKSY